MQRALARSLMRHGRVLLIGTDAPALDAAVLRQAAPALQDHDAVFVSALDGGYALVGQRRADPRWYPDMRWSHDRVMDQTRERLRAVGVRWAELPPVADIGEPVELVHVPPGWLDGLEIASRIREQQA
ncbi:hypothetical protein AQPW35_18930 [Rubrivivax pictus]|uniref:DUF2064 domain-containing protein n=2 Tax=Pseudaquabacterium pictum TaxID=2315236 RepID=A0A480ARY3_9BURK|nr:hypothetical protein AQPW35_18930 [Rubrivivax pictus]